MITVFNEKSHKSKEKYKNYRTLNTILETVDSFYNIGATSTSLILSITGIGLIVLPIYAGIACTLSLGNKILHKLILNKHHKYQKKDMKEMNKLLNLSMNYTENLYKII